jgi:hypothetical protein
MSIISRPVLWAVFFVGINMHELDNIGTDFIEEPVMLPDGTILQDANESTTTNAIDNENKNENRLGRTMDAIIRGENKGEHPALDKLVGPNRRHWPESICTPDCPNRNRSKQNIYDISIATPTNERLAVLDHRVGDLEKNMDRVTELAVRTNESSCSKDDLRDRIASIHKRLDRDMLPAIANLQKRRTFRDRVYPVWLTVSLIGNILTVYIILK